jgi:hypothetical protein
VGSRTVSGISALFLWVMILAAAGTAGCPPSCRLQGTGTIQRLEMEGGFFGIVTDSGDRYRPVNLPDRFASEGVRVRFCADPVQGLVGIQMWGTPVHLVSIEAETLAAGGGS